METTSLQLLSQLRSVKSAGQFPYGPMSLTQNAPPPPVAPAPAPPPPEMPEEDPRLGEMEGQIQQSQQELQKLQDQTRQQDSELKAEKLRTQQAQAESQLMKRDADLTKREADLVQQQADAQTQTDEKAAPHFSPTALAQLKNVQKKLQALTKKAADNKIKAFDTPQSYAAGSQELRDIGAARAFENADKGYAPANFTGENSREAYNASQNASNIMNTELGGKDRWLTEGYVPGVSDSKNWFVRNVSNRAINAARPLFIAGTSMGENAYDVVNGGGIKAIGRTALAPVLGVVDTLGTVSGAKSIANLGSRVMAKKYIRGAGGAVLGASDIGYNTGVGGGLSGTFLNMPATQQRVEDWTKNRLDTMESASRGRALLQGLSNEHKINSDMLGAPQDVSAQALNAYGQYAGRTQGLGSGSTFMRGTMDAYRGNQYGDPNTWLGQLLNGGLPYLSKLLTGGPRPTLQPRDGGLYR